MDNPIILVTGGAGYIGSIVVSELNKLGYKIIIIDDLSEGNMESIPDNCQFVEADFGDIAELEKIIKKNAIDIIIHLAAKANVPDSVVNPREYYQNNLVSTFNLLNFAVKNEVSKIIFSSTAAVYGDPLYTPIDEKHQTVPVNPYGWSKLMCEQLLKDYSKAYGLSYVIFRYFCAAGASEKLGESREKETHIIPLILDQLVGRRNKFEVFGTDFGTKDGTGVRDFIHVMDIAKAHILAIRNFENIRNSVFNLGNKEGYSVLDILKIAESMFSRKLNYVFSDRRPGDPGILIASNDAIFQKIGWKPERSIEDIISSSYQWQQNKLF